MGIALIEDVMLIEFRRDNPPEIIAPSNMSFVPVHEEQELHVRRSIQLLARHYQRNRAEL